MAEPGKELSSIDFKNLIGGPLIAVVEAQAQAALSTVNFIREIGFKKPASETGDKPEDLPTTGEPIYVAFKYPKEISPFEPATTHSISVEVTKPGSGYTSAPTVKFSGGGATASTAANANAIVVDGQVTSIEMLDMGTKYTSAPTVEITGGGGSGAEAKVLFTAAKEAKAAVFQEMKLEVPMLSIVPIPYLRVEEVTIDFNAKINSMQSYEYTSARGVNTTSEVKGSGGFLFGKVSASFKCSTSYQSNSKSTGQVERTYSLAVHVRAVQDELPGGMEKILGILEDAIKAQPA